MAHYEIPKLPSPQVKAVLQYLDQVKVFDLEAVGKHFVDDFVQSTRPLSLKVPSRTKEEDLKFLKGLSDRLGGRHLEITIYDIIDSELSGKAWAHLLLHGEPQEGEPFDIECIYQFTFVGGLISHKFKSITDFVDSKALASMG